MWLAPETVENAVKQALDELKVQTLDNVIYRIPEELIHEPSKALHETIRKSVDQLEAFCKKKAIQSYGFALPQLSPRGLETILDVFHSTLQDAEGFTALQTPVNLSYNVPLAGILKQFAEEKELFVIGEKPFDATLSSQKPFRLRGYSNHLGEDVALLLKTAFNLAISVERKYMEKILL